MNVSRDVVLTWIGFQIMDLRVERSIGPVVLGTLFGIMSVLPTTEASIDALALLVHWVGNDILDLGGGFVNILLLVGLVFHLSLLPGTSLLHWLPILLWLKLTLVVVVNRPII